jgi:hypothetical protein
LTARLVGGQFEEQDSFAATGRLLVLDIKKRLVAVLVLAVSILIAADGAGIHWDHVPPHG